MLLGPNSPAIFLLFSLLGLYSVPLAWIPCHLVRAWGSHWIRYSLTSQFTQLLGWRLSIPPSYSWLPIKIASSSLKKWAQSWVRLWHSSLCSASLTCFKSLRFYCFNLCAFKNSVLFKDVLICVYECCVFLYTCMSEEGIRFHHRWLWTTKQLLGIELSTSVRTTSALNHWAICRAPSTIHCKRIKF